jgi:hypothetical protein
MLPKVFLISCRYCNWSEKSSGVQSELTHLIELRNSCKTCGKPRKFKCPKCGMEAKMFRMKG